MRWEGEGMVLLLGRVELDVIVDDHLFGIVDEAGAGGARPPFPLRWAAG
jgi:hypothetical protein